MKTPLVIFGLGDFADLACFMFLHDSDYVPVAFCVDLEHKSANAHNGLPVICLEELEEKYPSASYTIFVAIGYSKMNTIRQEKVTLILNKGYKLASYISNKATIWPGFKYGYNCFIFENNNIQPFAEIGNNVILWSGNHIGHHSIIKDNVFLTSHVVVSGRVTIGNNCFIGVNSTIKDKVNISDFTLIGAGVLINANTDAYSVYTSLPAEKRKITSMKIKI